MAARRPPGWLERVLADGTYARLAAACETDVQLAEKLGTTALSIQKARRRLRLRGLTVPTPAEIRYAAQPTPASVIGDAWRALGNRYPDTATAPAVTTNPAETSSKLVGERWPSVAAFDEEEPTEPVGVRADVVPPHHGIKGVSSFVVDGVVRGQWIKTAAQNDERAEWLDAIRSISGNRPRVEAVEPPAHNDEDLLVVLPVGDPHVGLQAWHRDAGANFDISIAKRNLVGAFQHLIALAPSAAEALIIFIGDNSHVDSQNNTTTAGTRQDADGRTVKIADTIIQIARTAIDLCLAKFGRARMIVERGNHDELISAMLALALSLLYENEPRVTIDTSPEMYHWHRFGQNLIGTHHGDKAKPMDLLGVMAVDRADDWSGTRHRRFYCGHLHHQIVKEVPGLIVEYLPTLAGSDAWHRSMGYRSGRAMYMDVLHREHGHINRHIVGIRQLEGLAS